MKFKNNILETIGDTPLIKLGKIAKDIPGTILAKVETFNPGHSIKDRMGLQMIEDAEARGDLKPGGTVIECTSGNTGMGIALASIVKGYSTIFTTSDKTTKAKIDMLKAMGSEVIVCPVNVEPEDPRSYYSVAERLSKEIPNSFWCNQYDNLSNRKAHYLTTGPEIWKDTEGKVTHIVTGVGTGGTLSGVAKYIKEQNPNVKIWGIDTYGSVFKKFHETGEFDKNEIYPYITEGIGEDILPKNVDFDLIDHFEKVTDKAGALAARDLAKIEGILLGYSAGSAFAGLQQMKDQLTEDDVVVLIFHDHGSRYMSKIYNDDWMRDRGFINKEITVREMLRKKDSASFITVEKHHTISEVIDIMKTNNISQIPVMEGDEMVGSITESRLLQFVLHEDENSKDMSIEGLIGPAFPIVDSKVSSRELSKYITKEVPAVVAKDDLGNLQIVTQFDIIQAL